MSVLAVLRVLAAAGQRQMSASGWAVSSALFDGSITAGA